MRNQWRTPTRVHCSIRVWARVSLTIVAVRAPGWSVRPGAGCPRRTTETIRATVLRSEEHTSELQSRQYLVCRLLLEKKTKRLRNSTAPSESNPRSCKEASGSKLGRTHVLTSVPPISHIPSSACKKQKH